MDLKDIKAIIDLMKKNSISEFELERQDFKIRLKRGLNGGAALAMAGAGALEDAAVVSMPNVGTVVAQPMSVTTGAALPGAGASNEIFLIDRLKPINAFIPNVVVKIECFN